MSDDSRKTIEGICTCRGRIDRQNCSFHSKLGEGLRDKKLREILPNVMPAIEPTLTIVLGIVADADGTFHEARVPTFSTKRHYARKPEVAVRMALEEAITSDLARVLLEGRKLTIKLVDK